MVCVCIVYLQRSEDRWELVLSFHHMVPGDWTEFFSLGSKCLYLLGHLASQVGTFIILPSRWESREGSYWLMRVTFSDKLVYLEE